MEVCVIEPPQPILQSFVAGECSLPVFVEVVATSYSGEEKIVVLRLWQSGIFKRPVISAQRIKSGQSTGPIVSLPLEVLLAKQPVKGLTSQQRVLENALRQRLAVELSTLRRQRTRQIGRGLAPLVPR